MPLFFQFPGDTTTYARDDEFMLWPSLLVAPNLEPGSVGRNVYLPAGADWFDASDARYVGGFDAPAAASLNHTPVFVRAGAIVPKGPVMQYADAQPLRDVRLHLYPGPDTTFALYEDDGISPRHLDGEYLETEITRRDLPRGFACRILRARAGWAPPGDRSGWLDAHAFEGRPSIVTVNGVAVPEVASEEALGQAAQGWVLLPGRRLIVRVADSAAPLNVEVLR